MNRFWQQYFGTGIVKTAQDFGAQGDWPTHPELLDWLATELVDSGWNVKHLQKLIVMSGSYQQSSRATPELLVQDPENLLLARGPRFRMDAEVVRDSALAVSGLLVERLGGPSVKPYQPDGLWEAVGFVGSDTREYKQDHGEALYRRSMYTFWKRTSPPLRCWRSTPLRESVHSPSAAYEHTASGPGVDERHSIRRGFAAVAERMMAEGGSAPEGRPRLPFNWQRRGDRRPMSSRCSSTLIKRSSPGSERSESAEKLLAVGESTRRQSLNSAELAAWTMVANLILNLDETVTKE